MYARVPAPAAPRPAIARPGPGACHRAHGRRRQAGRDGPAADSWGISLRVLEGTNRRGIPSGTGTWRRSRRVPLHEPVGHPEYRLFGDQLEAAAARSEEHTSELQSLMRISYAVFFLNK